MSLLEDVADELAKRATQIIARTDDDTIEKRIAQEIGSSSPTLQEAFLTAMRIRRAELRGNRIMDKFEKGEKIEKAGISSQPQDEFGH